MFMFVGLDHMRALVYEHCKKLIENLMLLAAQENENVAVVLNTITHPPIQFYLLNV
jgi:hypothetical protein